MKCHADKELTAVIKIMGALGKMNFVSVNFWARRQFTTRLIQLAPWSPRPWRKITVAVCLFMAGTASGTAMLGSIVEPVIESVVGVVRMEVEREEKGKLKWNK